MKKKIFPPIFIVSIVVIFIAIFYLSSVQTHRIITGSMKDTLLVGDLVLVKLGSKNTNHPKRGDVIAFNKYIGEKKLQFIKRCVALPGDTLEIKQGIVYLNSKLFEEIKLVKTEFDAEDGINTGYYDVTIIEGRHYTIRRYDGITPESRNYGPIVVSVNKLFVLGDNRDNSADSRSFGLLPQKDIYVNQNLYFGLLKKV